MQTNTKESRVGRKPAFTPELALEIIEARRLGFQDVGTTEKFIDCLLNEGIIKRRLHTRTIQRLLNGKTFPYLIDPATNAPIDYSKVPKFMRGQPRLPPKELRFETGEPRERMTKIRRDLMERTLEESGRRLAQEFILLRQQLREEFKSALADLSDRLTALEIASVRLK